MTGRTILLTCDRLPSLFGDAAGTDTTIASFYDWLSSQTAVYENHYLQQPGLEALCASFCRCANSPPKSEQSDSISAIAVLSPKTAARLRHCMPDWITLCHGHAAETDQHHQLKKMLHECAHEVCWLHFDGPVDEENASSFQDVIELASEVIRDPDDMLIITSVRGHEEFQEMEFDTLLPECRIRIPMWIRRHQSTAVRLPDVTGSFDIAATICRARAKCDADNASPELLPQSGADLRGDIPRRTLRIELPGVTCLRTPQFLFVQRHSRSNGEAEPPGLPEKALYLKPEDVWNINDVSAEYLEATESLEASLLHQR